LGLQTESVRNQAEHVEALWESFLTRHLEPNVALQELSEQLLRTQKQWCTKVWEPFVQDTVAPDNLRDVCLFLCLWGELGNLRFCPELLCFLFAAARSFCTSNAAANPSSMWSWAFGSTGRKQSFLEDVVKPIFNVVLEETFDVKQGLKPQFKFGKGPAPANACNYDDWNEVFWDANTLKRSLRLKDGNFLHKSCGAVSSGAAARVWMLLPDVDWTKTLQRRKSYREFHSMLPLLVGHYRVFLIHSVSIVGLLLFQTKEATGWVQRASVGLIAPAWLVLYEVGFQALTPTMGLYSRLRALFKVIFLYFLPMYSMVPVVFVVYDLYGLREFLHNIDFLKSSIASISGALFLCLVVHAVLSLFVFLLATRPCAQNSCGWNFFPSNHQRSTKSMWAFWILTLAVKLTFDFIVTEFCAQALDAVWEFRRPIKDSYMVAVQMVVLLLPATLCVFSSLPFFTNIFIACVGAARGVHKLGGFKNFWNRRGFGFSQLPESLCKQVLQIPPEERPTIGWRQSWRWWNRMSDSELEAFVDVWGGMLDELRTRDLLSNEEHRKLSFSSAQKARNGPPDVPSLMSNAIRIANALPSNREAKRRILALARAAQMRKLPVGTVRHMPALSILIPHYSETVLYKRKDLFTRFGPTDLFSFLVQYFRDEFQNFAERVLPGVDLQEANFKAGRECTGTPTGIWARHASAASLAEEEKKAQEEMEDEFCKWCSMRMQTLWRTVEGVAHAYAKALEALLKHQEPRMSAGDRSALVRKKIQVVVAMQQYAQFSDPDSAAYDAHSVAAVEAMFAVFGSCLCIAYIDEEQTPTGKRYYTCMIDSDCPVRCGARVPKFRIELPGFPILGHGKSDNQNCAVVFTRGEILQMIDANQEAYFESALFLPMALQEFASTHDGRRPGILGFREHIFSNIGLPGRLAADNEFAFGTVTQRTMDWPLEARLHYGHPDMMDKLQMLQQGGVSKATRGLNLSEDVFAGIDLTLRGGWTKYREYFHVGKGRDMGFMSVMSFYAKVSMGNGEQAITRQWMRLGLGLPLTRLLGVFYTHVGFYLNQCLVSWSMKSFAFMVAFFSLSDESNPKFSAAAENMCTHYFGIFYLAFVVSSMLPLILEVLLEKGLRSALNSVVSSIGALNPIFASFQSKLMGHFFETTLKYGGAQYIPTGRGLATAREPFDKLVRCFSASHMHDGFEAALFLAISVGHDYGATFYICMGLSIVSWTIAPFLYNPKQFDSAAMMCRDFRHWVEWMIRSNGSEEEAWATWATNMQNSRQTASKIWIFVPSARLAALACTTFLVFEVVGIPSLARSPAAFQELMCVIPPISFAFYCMLMGVLQSCGLPECGYLPLSLLAVAFTVAEIWLLPLGGYRGAVLFHKYVGIRFMLEAADGIAAHRFGGCVLGSLHRACRLWALSWRLLRDFLLGLILMGCCFLLGFIPFISKLHTLFLFRTLPKKDARERLLSETGDSFDSIDNPLEIFIKGFASTASEVRSDVVRSDVS
jgi:1,3-beta-glucan synthase